MSGRCRAARRPSTGPAGIPGFRIVTSASATPRDAAVDRLAVVDETGLDEEIVRASTLEWAEMKGAMQRGAETTALFACCLILLAACGPGDSGGSPGAQSDLETWDAERELRIGSVDGGDQPLTRIRALEVGESGTIYTLHRQEKLIRRFDSAGTFLGSIGGAGEGPGEFQSPIDMGWVADTLWVLDTDGYRFSQFSPEGEFLGSFRVPFEFGDDPNAASPPRANGLLYDGTVHGTRPAFIDLIATGEITEHVPMLMTRDGRVTDTLPAVPFGNNDWIVHEANRGSAYRPQPFADGPLWSFAPGERAIVRVDRNAPRTAEDASFSVTKLSFSGDTVFGREFSYDPVPVTQVEVQSALETWASSLGEDGFLGMTEAEIRQTVERTLYQPPFKSLVQEMTVGRDGSIWLERTADADTVPWLVLDPSGSPRAEVMLPDQLQILEADRDHVWGQELDELDVPYLVRYGIAHVEADGQ